MLWKAPESVGSEKHLNRYEVWAFIKRKPIFRSHGDWAPKTAFGGLQPPDFFCPHWADPPEEPILASSAAPKPTTSTKEAWASSPSSSPSLKPSDRKKFMAY